MEDMLSDLIKLVGSMKVEVYGIKTEIVSMKTDIATMKTDIATMKTDITTMKTDISNLDAKVDKNHTEVMCKLKDMKLDQDHIWEKTVRNERDIAKLVRKHDESFTTS